MCKLCAFAARTSHIRQDSLVFNLNQDVALVRDANGNNRPEPSDTLIRLQGFNMIDGSNSLHCLDHHAGKV